MGACLPHHTTRFGEKVATLTALLNNTIMTNTQRGTMGNCYYWLIGLHSITVQTVVISSLLMILTEGYLSFISNSSFLIKSKQLTIESRIEDLRKKRFKEWNEKIALIWFKQKSAIGVCVTGSLCVQFKISTSRHSHSQSCVPWQQESSNLCLNLSPIWRSTTTPVVNLFNSNPSPGKENHWINIMS